MSSEIDANSAVVMRLVTCVGFDTSNGVFGYEVCTCHAPIIVTREVSSCFISTAFVVTHDIYVLPKHLMRQFETIVYTRFLKALSNKTYHISHH